MANVTFEDYSVKVKDALDDHINIALKTAAMEIQSQAQRRTPSDSGQLKGSWSNYVDDAETCIKLYKKDAAKGEEYMQNVISTYYMQGKHSECDKFSNIVAEKIAEMSFR